MPSCFGFDCGKDIRNREYKATTATSVYSGFLKAIPRHAGLNDCLYKCHLDEVLVARGQLMSLPIQTSIQLIWSKTGKSTSLAAFFLVICLMPGLLNAASYNGFDVSDSEIPRKEIKRGGPPRDGIPSIDKPRFMPIEWAESFLDPDDWIIGLEIDGDARAYPVKILNYHEIVNDRFNDKGVLISYCPLCRTAMAFESSIEGVELSFGVSGLLHNSDVLMYDRETESLWSQIWGRAISGQHRGTELDSIPVIHTTWLEWIRKYPESQALGPNTGYMRDYTTDPYAEYSDSKKLWYPVANRDKRFSNKEFVIGLKINDVARVWPHSELDKAWEIDPEREFIEDVLANQQIRVFWSPESRSAYITDKNGELLNGIPAYWFAWLAFYPDTEVFTVTPP